MSEKQNIPEVNQLPFNINNSKVISDTGYESKVFGLGILDNQNQRRDIVLKESRYVELADDKEMQQQKTFYENLKSHPKFGKFVVETNFVKAKMSENSSARAYRVQKFIPGRRIDEVSDREINSNKELLIELIEFLKASLAILKENLDNPTSKPDLYADRKKFLGNFFHNPRYSGNILISDTPTKEGQRVFFVDSGQMLKLKDQLKTRIGRTLEPISAKIQLLQLQRWINNLERYL